ncbi:hypothetical protein [uncultured Robinsoniella sp.]|uniref:hypothetical protein n=1 Tax=uncultured Robinsoniella sp. TaxID=904190 RepID=UPI00374EEA10
MQEKLLPGGGEEKGLPGKYHVNRKHKDCLFRLIFQNKRDLLELYNSMNGTHYENEEDLIINTMENVVYMGMKNDLSFLIGGTLNLYEHQSSINPNMPLRGLFYIANLYQGYIEMKDADIYGSKLIGLPMPQYLVFYNGEECIDKNILRDILIKNRGEVTRVILEEYDEEKHLRSERIFWKEKGREEGRELEQQSFIQLISAMASDGRAGDIARLAYDREFLVKMKEKYSAEHILNR